MEEYRDLGLTLAAFCVVLDEPEFLQLEAGIVLQAYLPDSWTAQQQLTNWAQRRRAKGGAGIKLRLVKGANLAMEQVEAELQWLEAAPYRTKLDTDANFRRCWNTLANRNMPLQCVLVLLVITCLMLHWPCVTRTAWCL